MAKPRITTYHRVHKPVIHSAETRNPGKLVNGIEMRLNDGTLYTVPFEILYPTYEYTIRRCMATFIEPENSD